MIIILQEVKENLEEITSNDSLNEKRLILQKIKTNCFIGIGNKKDVE